MTEHGYGTGNGDTGKQDRRRAPRRGPPGRARGVLARGRMLTGQRPSSEIVLGQAEERTGEQSEEVGQHASTVTAEASLLDARRGDRKHEMTLCRGPGVLKHWQSEEPCGRVAHGCSTDPLFEVRGTNTQIHLKEVYRWD